jgi:restriction system protein
MAVPDFQSVMLPFLEALQDGQERTMRELTEMLAQRFKLTDKDRQEHLSSGPQPLFYNRVAWAKTHLKNAGLIENSVRGKVSISAMGRKVLGQKPATVNCRFLKQFPSYLTFCGQKPTSEGDESDEAILETTKTPEESLEESCKALRNALADELLDRVKSSPPQFFERLVVQLLVRMGYGGSLPDAGRAIGRSGDGGIDGIINEDPLGLDIVCIQAKRWGNTVGCPEVQAFAGSMEGYRARKGVMLTTSTFSKQAKDYVAKIERKIVLIVGPLLAQLMLDHDIGVATARSYVVKKLDQDYFDDEGS